MKISVKSKFKTYFGAMIRKLYFLGFCVAGLLSTQLWAPRTESMPQGFDEYELDVGQVRVVEGLFVPVQAPGAAQAWERSRPARLTQKLLLLAWMVLGTCSKISLFSILAQRDSALRKSLKISIEPDYDKHAMAADCIIAGIGEAFRMIPLRGTFAVKSTKVILAIGKAFARESIALAFTSSNAVKNIERKHPFKAFIGHWVLRSALNVLIDILTGKGRRRSFVVTPGLYWVQPYQEWILKNAGVH